MMPDRDECRRQPCLRCLSRSLLAPTPSGDPASKVLDEILVQLKAHRILLDHFRALQAAEEFDDLQTSLDRDPKRVLRLVDRIVECHRSNNGGELLAGLARVVRRQASRSRPEVLDVVDRFAAELSGRDR